MLCYENNVEVSVFISMSFFLAYFIAWFFFFFYLTSLSIKEYFSYKPLVAGNVAL